ncbi:MAG: D-alanyl-D-alanine carboxypeptidase [Fervidobacterium sp.]|uniref:D-alanyl-D-alanine carboxypeptidase / D-alanyl-D-alanine-endopeptidase (Penicillin-binding protein 4) n=1 Tax=Fervidobacterium gondwanense DSM 13020 TaxID=1121883 RepID=A0A1M7SR98_FERGO|nr:D-alanyl-D-alanine carboxypeptidase [Fervidobacterium gondwanense]UXF00622.1 D-alanyl-D-alanine carboxypeptidase [Fervidobacterium riparium]SHN60908.1 D-alanyl-D-alanine carboxypeptidase / D-alanyl-D-alanine-endopeptidase (penicillin-binding protein 4) [Fervidobacterium gondwanense DSM 13020]
MFKAFISLLNRNKRILFSVSIFVFFILSNRANGQDVYSIITSKMPQGGYAGAYFVDIDSGSMLVKYNEHNLFIPASLTKIFSTLVAWDVLGPEFRYTTTVYVPRGNISPTLRGNIIIKGNGDPSMSVEILKEHLYKFVQEGVKEITGNIVIDNSFFSNERWGVGWEWDYKNPSIDALVLKENTNSFSPYDANAVAINYGSQVLSILRNYGIRVNGSVMIGKLNSDYREFIVMKSVPLKNLISVANKFSSNSYAEQILRTVGLRVYGYANVYNSLKVMNDFYKRLFGEYYPLKLNDACGLSTYNLLTPYSVVQVLLYAYRNYGGLDGFISTLAISGKEGTMQGRLGDITLYAKTGTLQKVSNIAGVMITRTGRKVAFAIMVNNFITPTYVVMQYHDEIIRYVWNNY